MEEKLRVAIGIPNEELGGLNMEEKRRQTTEVDESSKPPFSRSWWRQHWPSLKPFVNGGAVGVLAGSWACLYYTKTPMFAYCRKTPKLNYMTKVFPGAVYIHVFKMSQQLGLYEILRRKAISTNEGMPPTLYQEAACGLTVGAAGACLSFPLYYGLFCKQFTEQCGKCRSSTYRNLIKVAYCATTNKEFRENLSIMCKGANPLVKRKMWLEVGMLTSYNPSLHYLRESCGFSETRAQLGASAISAFFAAAFSLPSKHIRIAKQESEYASSLDCALKILKSRGPLGLYEGFSTCFFRIAPPIMTSWFLLERIWKLEQSVGL